MAAKSKKSPSSKGRRSSEEREKPKPQEPLATQSWMDAPAQHVGPSLDEIVEVAQVSPSRLDNSIIESIDKKDQNTENERADVGLAGMTEGDISGDQPSTIATWAERVRQQAKAAQLARPGIIDRGEISKADALLEPHRLVTLQTFQKLLDYLAGKSVKSEVERKQVADAVVELAEKSGIQLFCAREEINFRAGDQVFALRTRGAERTNVGSALFPCLTAGVAKKRTPGK